MKSFLLSVGIKVKGEVDDAVVVGAAVAKVPPGNVISGNGVVCKFLLFSLFLSLTLKFKLTVNSEQ